MKNGTTLVVITKAKGIEYRREKKTCPYANIKSYMGGHHKDTPIFGYNGLKYQNGHKHENRAKFSFATTQKMADLEQAKGIVSALCLFSNFYFKCLHFYRQ